MRPTSPPADRTRRHRSRRLRRAGVAAVAGLTAAATLQAPADATTGIAVPDVDAGALIGWGTAGSKAGWTLPTAYQHTAISAIAEGGSYALALTAAGQVVPMAAKGSSLLKPPSSLNGVRATSIAAGPAGWAMAVTAAGKVVAWGSSATAPVTDVAKVAASSNWAVALHTNHTVTAWGWNGYGQTDVPDGLDDVVDIAVGFEHSYALKGDGTVVPWGGRNLDHQLDLPPVLTDTTDDIDVTAIRARPKGGLALLSDHTVVSWGGYTTLGGDVTGRNDVPASLTGKTVVAIAAGASSETNLALDSTGQITVWSASSNNPEIKEIPGALDDAEITDLAINGYFGLALVKQVLPITQPTVSGTAKVGSTLTGTPARFSGTPATTTNQWLADGSPIPGATGTTLKLTNAQAGKRISYRSMATTAGDPVPATSSATAPVAAAPTSPVVTTVASKTKITKAKAKKHGKKVIIKVKVTAPGTTPTGKVKVVIKKGKKKASKTTTKLNAKGIAKIKITNKKKLTKKGKYKVTATYKGATTIKPSKTKTTYKV